MEKFKIRPSSENRIENNVIEKEPNVISSDIPYYTEIETFNNSISKFRNSYISSKERKEKFLVNKVEIEIGRSSGKVYTIMVHENTSIEQLKKLLKYFLKETISIKFDKESRYYNNVKFSTEIFNELNKELKNRCITEL
jgi:hypothetical protein